jgi:anti-sigma factor RsiW
MNCRTAEKRSIAYLDGSIDPRDRREMETHLAECLACRQRAQQLHEVWGMLEEMPVVCPSAGFDAAVRARVAKDGGARHGLWGWLIVPAPRLAFGVTALLIFSVWLSSFRPASRPPTQTSAAGDTEFRMIANLPVLENYDVLADFEVLSELQVGHAAATQPGM